MTDATKDRLLTLKFYVRNCTPFRQEKRCYFQPKGSTT
jgi:hypothetical protein